VNDPKNGARESVVSDKR